MEEQRKEEILVVQVRFGSRGGREEGVLQKKEKAWSYD